MTVPIDRITVEEVTKDGRLTDIIITVDKKVLRMILDDFWKNFNEDFNVEYHKNRYYLHLIKTSLHGYWTEIPDDTIHYIVRTYYTLTYPHQSERIIKRADKILFYQINIDELEGVKDETV